ASRAMAVGGVEGAIIGGTLGLYSPAAMFSGRALLTSGAAAGLVGSLFDQLLKDGTVDPAKLAEDAVKTALLNLAGGKVLKGVCESKVAAKVAAWFRHRPRTGAVPDAPPPPVAQILAQA